MCCIPLHICTIIHKHAGNFFVTISLHISLVISSSLAFFSENVAIIRAKHNSCNQTTDCLRKQIMLNKVANETFPFKSKKNSILLPGNKLFQTVASTCYMTTVSFLRAPMMLYSAASTPVPNLVHLVYPAYRRPQLIIAETYETKPSPFILQVPV